MLNRIKEIFEDLLDVEQDEVNLESYIVRDLEAESIDLLELAIMLNSNFGIKVNDEKIFLKRIREHYSSEKSLEEIRESYPHLSLERLAEIKNDLDNGPTLKIKDIIAYLEY